MASRRVQAHVAQNRADVEKEVSAQVSTLAKRLNIVPERVWEAISAPSETNGGDGYLATIALGSRMCPKAPWSSFAANVEQLVSEKEEATVATCVETIEPFAAFLREIQHMATNVLASSTHHTEKKTGDSSVSGSVKEAYDRHMKNLQTLVAPDASLVSNPSAATSASDGTSLANTDLYAKALTKEIDRWCEKHRGTADELLQAASKSAEQKKPDPETSVIDLDDVVLDDKKGEDNDDDDDTLKNPRTLSTDFYTQEEVDNFVQNLCEWLIELPTKAAEKETTRGIGYTAHHIAFYILKGINVMQRVKAEQLSATPLPSWVEELASRAPPPATVVNGMFSAFLYTAALRDCALNHKSPEECKAARKKEKAAKEPSHITFHRPDDKVAHGWDTSLWSVMNWVMRLADDPNLKNCTTAAENKDESLIDTATKVSDALELFKPLISSLDWFLANVPHERRIVFRGIRVRVSHKYKQDTVVVWPAFSSTSLDYNVAKGYMGSAGTFFIAHVHSAAMIDYLSEFTHEKEALLMSNRLFRVTNKVSRTVLQMLGCAWDIIHMTEIGNTPTPAEAVASTHEAQRHVVPMYEGYVGRYVEGRLADYPGAHEDVSRGVFTAMSEFLAAPNSERSCMLLLGSAGSGKTAAALACMSFFGSGRADVAAKGKKVISCFIPLSTVQYLESDGALDAAVCSNLNLSPQSVKLIANPTDGAAEYQLVVIFDSLDEVAVSSADEADSTESNEAALERFRSRTIRGLLNPQRNPLCAAAKVVVSCRQEFLMGHRISPIDAVLRTDSQEASRSVHVQYVQSFDEKDVETFVNRAVAADVLKTSENKATKKGGTTAIEGEEAEAAKKIIDQRTSYFMRLITKDLDFDDPSLTTTPVSLSMLVGTLITDRNGLANNKDFEPFLNFSEVNRITRCWLYESYLHQYVKLSSHFNDSFMGPIRIIMMKVALFMVKVNRWHLTMANVEEVIGDLVKKSFEGLSVADFVERFLPCRVEDPNDPDSSFEWSHKSIGEYLAARGIWENPQEALKYIGRPFSIDTPLVIAFFADLSTTSDLQFNTFTKMVPTFVEMINTTKRIKSVASRSVDHLLHNASNALALLCACRHSLVGEDFSRCKITKCNLANANLSGVSFAGARFDSCSFDKCTIDDCNIEQAVFTKCSAEFPVAPIMSEFARIRCCAFRQEVVNDDDMPTHFAFSSFDHPIEIWKTKGGKNGTVTNTDAVDQKLVSPIDGSPACALRFSRSKDKALLVVGNVKGHIYLIDAADGKILWTQRAFAEDDRGKVNGVAPTTAGKIFVVFEYGDPVLLNESDGTEVFTLDGVGGCNGCHASECGTFLATASYDGSVSIFSSKKEGKPLYHSRRFEGAATCVSFCHNRKTLAAGGDDRHILVVEMDKLEPDGTFKVREEEFFLAHEGAITQIDWGYKKPFKDHKPDDDMNIICSGDDGTISSLPKIRGSYQVARRLQHNDAIIDLCSSRTGSAAIIGISLDNRVHIWNLYTGTTLCRGADRYKITTEGRQNKDVDGVSSIAISHDDKLLFIASRHTSEALTVVSSTSGEVVRILTGHSGSITGLALVGDGQYLISGGLDGVLGVWSVSELSCVAKFTSTSFPAGETISLSYAEATDQLSVGCGSNIYLFSIGSSIAALSPNGASSTFQDVASEAITAEKIIESPGAVVSIEYSRDGKYFVATAGDDTLLYSFDQLKSTILQSKVSKKSVNGVAFAPDNQFVATCVDRSVFIWNVATASIARDITGLHTKTCTSVAYTPNNRYLITGSDDFTVCVVDASSGILKTCFRGHSSPVTKVISANDSQRAIAGAYDFKTIVFGGSSGGDSALRIQGHSAPVNVVKFTPCGSVVITGSDDGTVKLWSVVSGAEIDSVELPRKGRCASLDIPKDAPTQIVVGQITGYLYTFGYESDRRNIKAQCMRSMKEPRGNGDHIQCIAVSNDGKRACTGGNSGPLRIYTISVTSNATEDKDLELLKDDPHQMKATSMAKAEQYNLSLQTEIESGSWIYACSFNCDNTKIATGGKDKVIRVHEAETGKLLHTLSGHSSFICSVQWDPFKPTVLGGVCYGSKITLYDISKSEDAVMTHWGASDNMYTNAFCHIEDAVGKDVALVVGSRDMSVKLWNATKQYQGQRAQTPLIANAAPAHDANVTSVAATWCTKLPHDKAKRNHFVASCSSDGTVKIWELTSSSETKSRELRIRHVIKRSEKLSCKRVVGSIVPTSAAPSSSSKQREESDVVNAALEWFVANARV